MNQDQLLKIKQLEEKIWIIDPKKFSNIYRIWGIEKEIEKLEFLIAKNSSTKPKKI